MLGPEDPKCFNLKGEKKGKKKDRKRDRRTRDDPLRKLAWGRALGERKREESKEEAKLLNLNFPRGAPKKTVLTGHRKRKSKVVRGQRDRGLLRR